MHIEFLVEDQSGAKMLECLMQQVLPAGWTKRVNIYKGIGRIPPKGWSSDPQVIAARALLDNVPRVIEGYGKAYGDRGEGVAVIIVCDLDDRNEQVFRKELDALLARAPHRPRKTHYCLAIEEGEAWLLGDSEAVKAAYPKAKVEVLRAYQNDSICGTWEKLADAVYPGGSTALKKRGFVEIGRAKSEWAERITPRMVRKRNKSPSFQNFVSTVCALGEPYHDGTQV